MSYKGISLSGGAILGLVLLLAACAAPTHQVKLDEVKGPARWGEELEVRQLRHLYFAGQPDEAALQQAKADGVVTVINMRYPSEMEALNWDEAAAVEAKGMQYFHVPVSGRLDDKDRAAFAEVERIVKAQKGAPVLLHCKSGNRASAWLATHLHSQHGMAQAEALDIAEKTGLSRARLEKPLQKYWADSP